MNISRAALTLLTFIVGACLTACSTVSQTPRQEVSDKPIERALDATVVLYDRDLELVCAGQRIDATHVLTPRLRRGVAPCRVDVDCHPAVREVYNVVRVNRELDSSVDRRYQFLTTLGAQVDHSPMFSPCTIARPSMIGMNWHQP